MKFQVSSYDVGYPIYGAKFLDNNMLLTAGGGGEGNMETPNKISVLRIDFNKKKIIKRFREINLGYEDDSPTTLDVANNIILMGCNENKESIMNSEQNHHIRKFIFKDEHLKFVASVDFDSAKDPSIYTKLTCLSSDGKVGAIASSKVPTVIRIIDPVDLVEKYEIETGREVKDLHFSPNGKLITYITSTSFEVISIVTGKFITRKTDFNSNWILSKVRFLNNDTAFVAACLKHRPGIVVFKVSIKSGDTSITKHREYLNNIKGITSMDVDSKCQLVALSTNDNSISIIKLKDLSVGKTIKTAHESTITRVVFSANSQYMASVSTANTVQVVKIPPGFVSARSIFQIMFSTLFNLFIVVAIACLAHLGYKYDMYAKSYNFIHHRYIAKRDSSSYFQMNEVTGIIDDIVSISTLTKPIETDNSSFDTSDFFTESSIHHQGTLSKNSNVLKSSIIESECLSTGTLSSGSSGLHYLDNRLQEQLISKTATNGRLRTPSTVDMSSYSTYTPQMLSKSVSLTNPNSHAKVDHLTASHSKQTLNLPAKSLSANSDNPATSFISSSSHKNNIELDEQPVTLTSQRCSTLISSQYSLTVTKDSFYEDHTKLEEYISNTYIQPSDTMNTAVVDDIIVTSPSLVSVATPVSVSNEELLFASEVTQAQKEQYSEKEHVSYLEAQTRSKTASALTQKVTLPVSNLQPKKISDDVVRKVVTIDNVVYEVVSTIKRSPGKLSSPTPLSSEQTHLSIDSYETNVQNENTSDSSISHATANIDTTPPKDSFSVASQLSSLSSAPLKEVKSLSSLISVASPTTTEVRSSLSDVTFFKETSVENNEPSSSPSILYSTIQRNPDTDQTVVSSSDDLMNVEISEMIRFESSRSLSENTANLDSTGAIPVAVSKPSSVTPPNVKSLEQAISEPSKEVMDYVQIGESGLSPSSVDISQDTDPRMSTAEATIDIKPGLKDESFAAVTSEFLLQDIETKILSSVKHKESEFKMETHEDINSVVLGENTKPNESISEIKLESGVDVNSDINRVQHTTSVDQNMFNLQSLSMASIIAGEHSPLLSSDIQSTTVEITVTETDVTSVTVPTLEYSVSTGDSLLPSAVLDLPSYSTPGFSISSTEFDTFSDKEYIHVNTIETPSIPPVALEELMDAESDGFLEDEL